MELQKRRPNAIDILRRVTITDSDVSTALVIAFEGITAALEPFAEGGQ